MLLKSSRPTYFFACFQASGGNFWEIITGPSKHASDDLRNVLSILPSMSVKVYQGGETEYLTSRCMILREKFLQGWRGMVFAGRSWVRANRAGFNWGACVTCLGTEDDRQGDEAEICRGHCDWVGGTTNYARMYASKRHQSAPAEREPAAVSDESECCAPPPPGAPTDKIFLLFAASRDPVTSTGV
jgi:hypothetical protein